MDVAAEGYDYSIRAVTSGLGGSWTGAVTWADGSTSTASLAFEAEAWELQAVEYAWEGEGDPQDCPPGYRFTIPVQISTGGGEINESRPLVMEAQSLSEARIELHVAATVLGGTLRPSTFPEHEWGDLEFHLGLHSTGATWTGQAAFGPPVGAGGGEGDEAGEGADGSEGAVDTSEPPTPIEPVGEFLFDTHAAR